MRWPWSKEPKVEERSYTDLIVAGLLAAAEGKAAEAGKSATIETVAGALGRIVSAAGCFYRRARKRTERSWNSSPRLAKGTSRTGSVCWRSGPTI